MLPSHELVDQIYNDLVDSTRRHSILAYANANIKAQAKIVRTRLLIDKEITGKNDNEREANWQLYAHEYLGYEAYWYLMETLPFLEAEAKRELDVDRINVERLRLHVRIHENEPIEMNVGVAEVAEYMASEEGDTPAQARADSAHPYGMR